MSMVRKYHLQDGVPFSNAQLATELRNMANAVNVSAKVAEGVHDLEMVSGQSISFTDNDAAATGYTDAFGKFKCAIDTSNIYDHISVPSSLYAAIVPSNATFTRLTFNANNQSIVDGAKAWLLEFAFYAANAGAVSGHQMASATNQILIREDRYALNANLTTGENPFHDEWSGAAYVTHAITAGTWRRPFVLRLRNYAGSNSIQYRFGLAAFGANPTMTIRLLGWWI